MTAVSKNWQDLSQDEIFAELKSIMSNMFEIDEEDITKDASLVALDLDSIDAVDMVVEVQKRTGVKFKPEDFKQVRTVNDIVEVVHQMLQKTA